VPYIIASRLLLVVLTIGFLWLIRVAWKRNHHDERIGFTEFKSEEVIA
jgi:hypothetical protein